VIGILVYQSKIITNMENLIFICQKHRDTGYDATESEIYKVYFNPESALNFFSLIDNPRRGNGYFYSLEVWDDEKCLDEFYISNYELKRFKEKYLK